MANNRNLPRGALPQRTPAKPTPGSVIEELRRRAAALKAAEARAAAARAAQAGETSIQDAADPEGPRPEERLRVPKEAPKPAAKPAVPGLNARSLRRAVILSEILSPPLAKRDK